MAPTSSGSLRKAAVLFTFGRIGLFGLVAIIVWGASGLAGHQVNGLPLLLAAALGSSLLAFVLLRDQRDRFSQAIADSRDAKTAELAARRARLDDA
jgi:hypothetical protein